MLLLSIDVGIRNLAMCLIDDETSIIKQWDVSGIPPRHELGIFPCLRDHLDAREWVLDADIVLIEKQPGMNKTMKTVENFLHAYFVIKIPSSETIIYDARHKVPDVVGKGKAMYRKRKQAAIDRCRQIVCGTEWESLFNNSTKKDDLADTLLQALSFMKRIDRKPTNVVTVPRPRKPTEHQKSTSYSKANLVWLLKNTQNPQNDKRFMKDLKKYYSSVDELLKIIDI